MKRVVMFVLAMFLAMGALAADHRSSVVVVRNPLGGWASGVVFNKNRVVTVNHALLNAGEAGVFFYTKKKKFDDMQVADVIDRDVWTDLALLEVKTPKDAKPAQPNISPALVGEEVTIISHPQGQYWTVVFGRVARASQEQSTLPEGYKTQFLVDAPIAPGSSGGGVFRDNKLIGLVSGHLTNNPNLSFIIPIENICRSLAKCQENP